MIGRRVVHVADVQPESEDFPEGSQLGSGDARGEPILAGVQHMGRQWSIAAQAARWAAVRCRMLEVPA